MNIQRIIRTIGVAFAGLAAVSASAPLLATGLEQNLRITTSAPPISSQDTDFRNLKQLVLVENQVVDLKPGGYRYDILEFRPNSKLRIYGSTTILAGKVIAGKGATVEYIKGSSADVQKTFSLNAIDASGISDLTVIASGGNARDFVPGQRAADGRAGEGAMSQMVTGAWYEVPYWKNRAAAPGGAGISGANGRAGESAVDVTLYLPGLRSGATVVVETIGGRGGRGQDGGYGGQGGGSARLHPAANGGPGGPAGSGGRGGNAGKTSVFIVVTPAEVSNKDEIVKTITFRPSYAAGIGGKPGLPGAGGTKGDSREHFCIGAGCGSEDGKPGVIGHAGPPGSGPLPGEVNPQWAAIDVMDLATYQQYVSQVWTKLSQPPQKLTN